MDANPPRVQLSCEQCQRRKTKCDKTTPCCACRKAGLNCTSVQRHRLPRGRSGNSRANASVNAALKDRVNKLEAAVQRLQRNEPATVPSRAQDHDGFVASGFWDELMDAVGGLREVLADPDEEPNEPSVVPSPESASSGTWSAGEAAGLLLGANGSSLPTQAARPSSQERAWLQNLYQDRVDAIFKVLHWPTACSMIDYKTPAQATAEVEALEYAIYFAAMCTTLSFEIDDRDSKIGHFRLATEAALIRANLLTTKSLTTLQAFVLYLIGLRSCQSNAQTWTLIAVAIRIASAQGLDERPSRNMSPLEMETRNRVWCSIGVLDVRCCLDRGTKPLLSSSAFPCMPLNIDDHEISSETVHIEGHPESRYTSMSYCHMNHRALTCQLKIMELGTLTLIDNRPESIALAWKQQLVALEDFETFHNDFVRLCSHDQTPIRKLGIAVSAESLVSMRLLLRRPFYKQARDLQTMSEDSFDVLATATEVLESSTRKAQSNDFAQWSWFTWPKWFALAIVLAELCGPADGKMNDRAWSAAKECYGRYMHQVADTPSGLLWRPIAKLMKRASLVRGRVGSATADVASAPQQQQHQQQQQVPVPSSYAVAASSDSHMTGTQKHLPPPEIDFGNAPMDLNFGNSEAMSWFNWELFVEDLNSQDFSMSLDETYLG